MGQYADAATSFEFIMSEKGDLKSGLHLILCYYALGDVEKIRKAFQMLLEVPIEFNEDEKLTYAGNVCKNLFFQSFFQLCQPLNRSF